MSTETPTDAEATVTIDQSVESDNKAKVDDVIRKHIYGAVALGLAPLPLVNLAGLVTIQVNLVRCLSNIYGVDFKPRTAKLIIVSLVGGILPVATSPLLSSLLRPIPIVGLPTALLSLSALSGAATYSIGRVFSNHFAGGGTLADFQVKDMKQQFRDNLEEGRAVVSGMAENISATAT